MSSEMVKPGILRADGLFPPWMRHGFTTRTGGASRGPYESLNLAWRTGDDPEAVRENHARLGGALGYQPEDLATVHQVHGTRVITVRAPVDAAAVREEDADGIVIAPRERAGGDDPAAAGRPMAAAVRVADCCPVLLASLGRPAAAALHCGWRSLVAGLVDAGVAALLAASGAAVPGSGRRPGRLPLVAAVGPCIGPDAFEVGEEVAEAFAERVGAGVVLRRRGRPRPHVDLALAAREMLVRAGVPAGSIRVVRGCTFSEPDVFFSYRRDGERSGRQMGVVVIDPRPPGA